MSASALRDLLERPHGQVVELARDVDLLQDLLDQRRGRQALPELLHLLAVLEDVAVRVHLRAPAKFRGGRSVITIALSRNTLKFDRSCAKYRMYVLNC